MHPYPKAPPRNLTTVHLEHITLAGSIWCPHITASRNNEVRMVLMVEWILWHFQLGNLAAKEGGLLGMKAVR